MLRIQDDTWREDCVAMIGMDDDDECVIQVLPVGQSETFDYAFDDSEEADRTKGELVVQWEAFFAKASGE
jgi:hypothetical protein